MTGLLSLISNERTGGLQGFLDQFRRGGLGDIVSSWVSRGASTPLTAEQLERAVGGNTISRMASNINIPRAAAGSALAFMIPKVIDLLTPEGVVPTRLPAWVNSYLGAEPARAEAARTEPVRTQPVRTETVRPPHETTRRADTRGSTWLRLLPLLALPLLGFLAYRACDREPEQIGRVAVTPTPTATIQQEQAQTQVPSMNSRLSLINTNGKIRYSGVVPDEQSKQTILNQLRSTYGAGNISGDIAVDSRARTAAWTSGLSAALPNFKTSGAELKFDGDSINVGGSIPENAKSDMVANLKSVYGDNVRVGALDVASSVAESGRMASEALSSLRPGFSAEELTGALNKQIINFAPGSAQIPQESRDLLEQSASAIKSAPEGTVLQIGGHTDNTGAAAANQRLSQQRAESVRRFLVSQGVNSDELVAKGYGADKPVASNDTAEGRLKNRRIEYTVLK
ncbi:MAG: OmpA family protein [Blastocatellales bacterium]